MRYPTLFAFHRLAAACFVQTWELDTSKPTSRMSRLARVVRICNLLRLWNTPSYEIIARTNCTYYFRQRSNSLTERPRDSPDTVSAVSRRKLLDSARPVRKRRTVQCPSSKRQPCSSRGLSLQCRRALQRQAGASRLTRLSLRDQLGAARCSAEVLLPYLLVYVLRALRQLALLALPAGFTPSNAQPAVQRCNLRQRYIALSLATTSSFLFIVLTFVSTCRAGAPRLQLLHCNPKPSVQSSTMVALAAHCW